MPGGAHRIAPLMRVELHVHSEYSPDSRSTLAQLVARCGELGVGRMALTDHNTAIGALELTRLAPDLAIVAEEVRTTEGEIIGLFLTGTIPAGLRPEEVLDQIHQVGGLTYLAHPLDPRRASFRFERIVELAPRVDIIETYNAWAPPAANAAAEELARELKLAAAWGGDAHSTAEMGHCWMEMEPWADPPDFLRKLREAHPRRVGTEPVRRRA